MAALWNALKERIMTAMNGARQSVLAIDNAANAEAAYSSIQAAHKSTLEAIDAIVVSVDALEERMQTTEATVNLSIQALERRLQTIESTTRQTTHRKPMSESRCISNLKVLGSDKSEFKSWNEKLINAAAQSLGTPWRKYMRNLNKALDMDRKVLDDNQLNQIEGAEDISDGRRAAEDMFYVLVEKRRETQHCVSTPANREKGCRPTNACTYGSLARQAWR